MPSLQLVCHPSWMRDEMASADVDLYHSYGLEVPIFSYEDIWWMPQGFAVELNKALTHYGKNTIELIAPGVALLPSIPEKYTGRKTETLTAQEALANPKSGWWKSAEAKIDNFGAAYRTASDLVRDINSSDLPSDAILYYTETTLPISREFRSFIANGEVLTTSVYLVTEGETQTTIYDGAKSLSGDSERVVSFLTKIIEECEIPPSVVIDTAILTTGELVLLEFNPSWCSAWYDCDINEVVNAIQAGFHLDETQLDRWRYVPDTYFANKIAKRAILPTR